MKPPPIVRYLIIGAIAGGLVCLMVAVFGCTTIPAPEVPAPVTAAIDCALPSLWNTVTPDAVERDVIAALQQKDPIAALEALGESVGEAEVTCVVARDNSTVKMATILEFDGGVRAPITQQWLEHEAAKGLRVKNFATLGE